MITGCSSRTCSAVALAGGGLVDPRRPARTSRPYIPTPDDVVDRMLDVREGDARRRRVRPGMRGWTHSNRGGEEVRGERCRPRHRPRSSLTWRNRTPKPRALTDSWSFAFQNVLTADVSTATVVTLYLLSSSNERLRPMLTQQLKPGARIVSHAFSMGRDWPADSIDQFVSARGDEVTLYLWKIK